MLVTGLAFENRIHLIEELAEIRDAEQVDRFEKCIDRKSEVMVRAMVSRYIAERDRSKDEQEASCSIHVRDVGPVKDSGL